MSFLCANTAIFCNRPTILVVVHYFHSKTFYFSTQGPILASFSLIFHLSLILLIILNTFERDWNLRNIEKSENIHTLYVSVLLTLNVGAWQLDVKMPMLCAKMKVPVILSRANFTYILYIIYTLFFIRTVNFFIEAEHSYFFQKWASNILSTFLVHGLDDIFI